MVRDVVFFFFKQKTAYEMRISDWSSDVCSSDLLDDLDLGHRRAQIIVEPVLVGEGLFVREQHAFVGDRDDIVVERARRDRLLGLLRKQRPSGIDTVAARERGACLAVLAGREGAAPGEIGRASCRERGCKYA